MRSALTLENVLGAAALFVLTSAAGLALAAWFVVRMPANYFCFNERRPPERRPGLNHWARRTAKNVLGIFLMVLGLVLALPGVPGPGLLIVLIGIMLADFPAKHRLEYWFVSRPGILAGINKLRSRYGKPPMVVDGAPGGK